MAAADDASMRPAAIGIGMVGAGFMGRTHSAAYRAAETAFGPDVPRADLRCVVDVEPRAAEAVVRHFGWQRRAADWRAVTRADDVDLVDIVAPNDQHAAAAIDAARHGKAILCEKPLAHDLATARRVHRAVRDAGVFSRLGFVLRAWPAVTMAKRLAASGVLGEIVSFRASYFHEYALAPDFPMGWRFRRSAAGSGAIGDLGSHLIDLARYLVGEIDRVAARTRTLRRERPGGADPVDVDDACDMLFEFAGGAAGTSEVCWMAAGHKMDLAFELLGDQGSIRFCWRHSNQLEVYSATDAPELSGSRVIVLGPQHDGVAPFAPLQGAGMGVGDLYAMQAGQVLRGLGADDRSPDFLDGLRACEVIDAALRSARLGSWVGVERDPG